MTNAGEIPRFETWSGPQCPFTIEYDADTLPQIGQEVTKGGRAKTQGGIEVGGLLLGTCEEDRIRILGWEPVQCEYAFGPKFILSDKDAEMLAGQISAHTGDSVVGWYHSHIRRGLTFSAEDRRIFDRYFPDSRQIALLLRPGLDASVHARFMFREPRFSATDDLGQSEPFRLGDQPPPAPQRPKVRAENAPDLAAVQEQSDVLREYAAAVDPLLEGRLFQPRALWGLAAGTLALGIVSAHFLRSIVSVAAVTPPVSRSPAAARSEPRKLPAEPVLKDEPAAAPERPDLRTAFARAWAAAEANRIELQKLQAAEHDAERLKAPDTALTSPKQFQAPQPIRRVQAADALIPPPPDPMPAQQQPPIDLGITLHAPLPLPARQPPVPSAPKLLLAGRWVLQRGGYSRSPSTPEFVSITIGDTNGELDGKLEAQYRPLKSPRIQFSFSGTVANGTARFPWTNAGQRGVIEFIPVPNTADAIEVVWYGSESKQVFNEMLRRAN